MTKNIFKRAMSMLLAFMMVVTLIPMTAVTAYAVTVSGSLDDEFIGFSGSDDGTVTASGSTIELSVTASKWNVFGKNVSVTITNKKTEKAKLSFHYELVTGSLLQVANEDVQSSGDFSGEIPAGGTVKITAKAAKSTTAKAVISNIKLFVDSEVTTIFVPSENGSYTVDGINVTEEMTRTQSASQVYALEATPEAGYQFLGWYDVDTNEPLGTAATMNFTSTTDQRVTAKFAPASSAIFETAGANFADLNDAISYAAEKGAAQITLVGSGAVGSGDYTIPVGVTLLIPHDSTNAVYTEAVTTGSSILEGLVYWSKPTTYKTMTMVNGANITVNGAICVGGKHSAQTRYSGSPTQSVGMIEMLKGSSVTLNSGANLYCWGFIYGNGKITAKSGATVHENFQIADFRGGNATSGMAKEYAVFPLSQYYVQNVEVSTTYEYGAKEKVWTSIYMTKNTYSAGVDFIGEGAMFVPAAGASITKTYDPSTDRLKIEVNGNGAINSMSLSLGGTSVQSKEFPLPINSNIDIVIHSGTTTLNQTIAMLPGSSLTVDEGAELILSTGTPSQSEVYTGAENLFIYDADEWKYGLDLDTLGRVENAKYVYNNVGFVPVAYTPSRSYTRTDADLVDVKIDINGTVTTEGFVYTTAGGASIISSKGTGKFVMKNGAGADEMTMQATQADTAITYLVIPMTSAQLKNADGSYTQTAGAGVGTKYIYKNGKWGIPATVTWVVDGEVVAEDEYLVGDMPKYTKETPTKTSDNKHVTYEFTGWSPELTEVTGDATYTAEFKENTTVCVDATKDHKCDICEAAMGDHVQAEGKHTCDYCGGKLSECADGNSDHNCDVCGEKLSECADSDNDHNCDVCGKELTTCADNTNDHLCDICGKKLSDCKDVDKDHNCDICGKKLSDCADADKNHSCDVCGKKLSECADDNNDHNCDLCGKKLSDCKDEDKNHNCDLCGKELSKCADADKNHYCDVCGKKLSDCADSNNDHNCDLCGKKLTDCVDANKDHACDTCGAEMGKHADADKDHVCDYGCSVAIGTCEDANKDHACDYGCGKAYGEHVQAEGKHTCDYCGATMSECSGGTATCLKKAVCEICGNEYGELNSENHEKTIIHTDNGDGTHTSEYECCGADEVIAEHEYTEGKCVCENVQILTVTWNNEDGSKITTTEVKYGECPTAPTAPTKENEGWYKFEFIGWKDENGNLIDETTVVTDNVTYTAAFEKIGLTGWQTDENGKTYVIDGEQAYFNAWVAIEGNAYYFAENGYVVTGIQRVAYPEGYGPDAEDANNTDYPDATTSLFIFNEEGVFQSAQTGFITIEGTTRYAINGQIPWHVGLVQVGSDYYYFARNGMIAGCDYVVAKTNELLSGGKYTFDTNGVLMQLEGLHKVNGVLCYYDNWIKTYAGLIQLDGNYYYINSKGEAVCNREYWITKTNGLLDAGWYTFDENGVLIIKKNGIVEEDGKKYYYVDDVKTYAGLIKIGDDYYYVRSNFEVVCGQRYYVAKTNNIMNMGWYEFDADGKMLNADPAKNGIVKENGTMYYYKNGAKTYAGLIEIDGAFYYVRSSGEVVNNCRYFVSKTNNLMKMSWQEFDADGKMIIE